MDRYIAGQTDDEYGYPVIDTLLGTIEGYYTMYNEAEAAAEKLNAEHYKENRNDIGE